MDWSTCVSTGTDIATLRCLPVVYGQLVNAALMFAGSFAVCFIVFAGFKLINSGGNPEKVKSAKGTLTMAIVGLVVVIMSFFVINVISYFTGVECIKTVGFDNCT